MKNNRRSMTRRVMVLLYPVLMLAAGGCGSYSYERYTTAEEAESIYVAADAESLSAQEEAAVICVYVCGAVRKSGVYTLDAGARVCDAVAAAGGLTEEADETAVNQAKKLDDGEQVTIPAKAETGGESGVSAGAGNAAGRVNINTADRDALMTLSGIGEVKAADIIAYREAHGRFQKKEDIMQVPGIKKSLYAKIEEQIEAG